MFLKSQGPGSDQKVVEHKDLFLISWQTDMLKKYFKDTPQVEAIFQRLFGDEITRRKSNPTDLA